MIPLPFTIALVGAAALTVWLLERRKRSALTLELEAAWARHDAWNRAAQATDLDVVTHVTPVTPVTEVDDPEPPEWMRTGERTWAS